MSNRVYHFIRKIIHNSKLNKEKFITSSNKNEIKNSFYNHNVNSLNKNECKNKPIKTSKQIKSKNNHNMVITPFNISNAE